MASKRSSRGKYSAFACVALAIGIALGAFGAHGLEESFYSEREKEIWNTATLYWLLHAVAILALASRNLTLPLKAALGCIIAGMLIFSGTLYLFALGGPGWLGAITPIGGSLFILGWLICAFALVKRPTTDF